MEYLPVTDLAAAYFVAAHPGASLDIEVRLIKERDLAGYYGLAAASLKGYRSDKWWSDVTRILGDDRACQLFEALEESLTTYPPDDRRPDVGTLDCPRLKVRP